MTRLLSFRAGVQAVHDEMEQFSSSFALVARFDTP